jgi:cysteinyl-tRNA synthetase
LAVNSINPATASAADRSGFEAALFALGLDPGRGASAPVPDAVSALAARRWEAKKAKDFGAADALRKDLAAAGWSMLDGKDGYKLEPLKKA